MKMIVETLLNIQQKGSLVGIFSNPSNPDNFVVGYVIELLEDILILNSVDEIGSDDGLMVLFLKDIYAIDFDTRYLQNLEFIADGVNQNHKKYPFYNDLLKIFAILHKENELLSIKHENDFTITGFVSQIHEESLTINNINDSGNVDGFTMIYIDDIERIHILGQDQKKYKLLIKKNKL